MILTGTVLDTNRTPLIGVNIFPLRNGKSYGVGGVTDFDGNFEIEIEDLKPEQIVKFKYIGFKPVEATAKSLKNKTILMEESAIALDEIVVIAKKKKKAKNNNKVYGLLLSTVSILSLGLIIYKLKK